MGTRKRVLLIDPWEEDRGEIQRRLQSDVPESELISMQTLLEEEHLERLGAVDLILTEWLLPGMKGSEALSLLQQRWPGVPVVVVTRERSPQQVAAAFRAGAKDVLLKSSEDLARLPEVVAAMLSSLSSLSALPPAILHALIENAHETFLILNPDGTIRYGSPAIQRTLGYPPEELSGERLFDLLHPEDLPLAVEVFQQRLHAPNEIATLELRFRHRDGSWRVLEVSGRAVWLDRAIRGLALVCRDLTEQRLIE
ncbi:MAG: PAS domain S-box protein, partial [Anaerolineae bacterium]